VTDAYAGFEGRVGRTVAGSEPWWPPRREAPEDAPNILVILIDDLGYSDVGCYGSEIRTPNVDGLAARGLRYTNFHVTPMCSPTRSSLLTGLNAHRAGVGHVAHSDSGFPGYAMELTEDAATAAEIFRDAGWSTFMAGKWHLAKDSDLSAAGPRHSWPCQRGFERFYGILDGFTNLHHPHRLLQDNSVVEIDQYPDGYFLTDDLTDRVISWWQELRASHPRKPWFTYLAHPAVHAPLHAKPDDIERYRGAYEAGWDDLRARRFARQQELGIVEPETQVAPRNTEEGDDVRPWDVLSDDERRLFARHMEVYAAAVDGVDQSIGRLLAALDDLGQRDNTIIVFTSDNGASREGEEAGTSGYYVHLLGQPDVDADLARIDLLGGPQTMPHYPRGWAMAGNTPFRLYKINTHAGGHRVPFVLSWPRGVDAQGELRRQYAHVVDLLPTLLDLTGVEAPSERHGRPLIPMAGTSFGATLADPGHDSTRTEQVYEMAGHRGYYRQGWEVVTRHRPLTPFDDDEWELYDLVADPTELADLAAEHPERVAELAAAWEAAAHAEQIYPLDEGSNLRFVQRPERSAVFSEPVTILPGTPTLERWRSMELINMRSFTVTATVDLAPGDRGWLVAHGDQGGGYGLHVDGDALWWVHNDGKGQVRTLCAGPVPAGPVELSASVSAPGGFTWDVALLVDGEERATDTGYRMLFPISPFEGIDVGLDRRSPVSWAIYRQEGPFAFTGTLHHVRYLPGEPAPDSAWRLKDVLREMGAHFE
jgi:arylsulfatase A-like enzyme